MTAILGGGGFSMNVGSVLRSPFHFCWFGLVWFVVGVVVVGGGGWRCTYYPKEELQQTLMFMPRIAAAIAGATTAKRKELGRSSHGSSNGLEKVSGRPCSKLTAQQDVMA